MYSVNGQNVVRVSTILDYAFPFDSNFIAGYVAKSRGVTKAEVVAEWEHNRDLGTAIHNALSNTLMTGECTDYHNHVGAVMANLEGYKVVFSESSLARKVGENTFAGTIDLLVKGKDGLFLYDLKTIDDFAKIDKSYGKCRLSGLEHLRNSKLGRYALQLNFYKILAGSMPITGMRILWLNTATCETKITEITDKQEECLKLLEIYFNDKY